MNSMQEHVPEEVDLIDLREVPGEGPRADCGDRNGDFISYRVSRDPAGEAAFVLFRNNEIIMKAYASDDIDPLFSSSVADLVKLGKEVFLLSGDAQGRIEKASQSAGGLLSGAYFGAGPKEKEEIVKKDQNSLMFGDGVNDALALKAAGVGVAASGGVDLALASSEVYLCRGGIEMLLSLFKGAKRVMSIVKTNIFIASAYNIIFVIAAILGQISPLAAAVLMPISSLTLLIISLARLRSFGAFLSN